MKSSSAVHHMLRQHVEEPLSQTFYRCASDNQSSRGTHLLHGEGHAYPVLLQQHLPRASLSCVDSRCVKAAKWASLRRRTGCVSNLEACQSMRDVSLSPGYEVHPQLRLGSFIGTSRQSAMRNVEPEPSWASPGRPLFSHTEVKLAAAKPGRKA